MNRGFLAAIFVVLVSQKAFPTEQIPERLELTGAFFPIAQKPLQSHPDYENLITQFAEVNCSANWRGYRGTWTIFDSKLWLIWLESDVCDEYPTIIELADYFNVEEEAVFAEWYSAEISYRIGPSNYLPGTDQLTYEAVIYELENGEVLSRTIQVVSE